jgi:hypothetical protein
MRVARIIGRVAGVMLALAAGSASYIAADAAWGSAIAAAAVLLALVVAPLMLAGQRLPEEEAWHPSAGVRRWSRFVVACSALVLLLLASTARISVCDAFRGLPARHPELGPVARGFARLGAAIAPRTPMTGPGSAPSAPSPGSAPDGSAAPRL